MSGFQQYMELIRNETVLNPTLLGFCQNEICGVLWGIGNPDVSGIGMTAGYVTQMSLGFTLAACCQLFRHHIDNDTFKKLKLWSFFTSAIYFTMSLLVAINYSLARRDFDISAEGFGIVQAKIISTISVLCVLPLLYPLVMGLPGEDDTIHESDRLEVLRAEYNSKLQARFRLVLSGLVMALFVYPFVSQCIHNWAPTDIGENNGPSGITVVSVAEWDAVTDTCFGEYTPIRDAEDTIISVFEMLGSLVLRDVERALATTTTSIYIDNDWTFGQVVALVIFAPVLFDFVRCFFEL
ncbi:hypothetical protein B0T22DRAFT_538335 [Podospora appendiculata]|uniref:Uncharacterized protein n=1 Tax=Podospora appendiculata TaxID=314037 RepID=A0AAE0X6S9_9PEZI|nr:hypothetical protein B0T22DRAFT_538335 [Podospora appendiculata]